MRQVLPYLIALSHLHIHDICTHDWWLRTTAPFSMSYLTINRHTLYLLGQEYCSTWLPHPLPPLINARRRGIRSAYPLGKPVALAGIVCFIKRLTGTCTLLHLYGYFVQYVIKRYSQIALYWHRLHSSVRAIKCSEHHINYKIFYMT